MPLKPRTSKISMDFFLSSDFYPASANAAACSEDIQAAMVCHADRCSTTNACKQQMWVRRRGREWPRMAGSWDSQTSQYMDCSISRMSTSKRAEIAAALFTRLEISTGKRKRCHLYCTGRQAQWLLAFVLGLPAQKSSPVWKMVNVDPKSGGSHISWGIASSAEA